MVCWDEREESQICKISVVLFPVIFILSYSLKSYIPDSVTKPKSNGHFFASFAFCLPKLLPRDCMIHTYIHCHSKSRSSSPLLFRPLSQWIFRLIFRLMIPRPCWSLLCSPLSSPMRQQRPLKRLSSTRQQRHGRCLSFNDSPRFLETI